jgi:hypothetical protein
MGFSYVLPADWTVMAIKPPAQAPVRPPSKPPKKPQAQPPDETPGKTPASTSSDRSNSPGPNSPGPDPPGPDPAGPDPSASSSSNSNSSGSDSSAKKETLPQRPADEIPVKGTACIRVPVTAEHGDPTSVIVVVELPFSCYGQPMSEQDLAGFGLGAAEGLKQDFDLIDPVFGLYELGSHHLWIERAKGAIKGQPQTQYTMEIACSMLRKGAACWMTMAADGESLHAFENGPVTLDDDAATPLVPANAFEKPPS